MLKNKFFQAIGSRNKFSTPEMFHVVPRCSRVNFYHGTPFDPIKTESKPLPVPLFLYILLTHSINIISSNKGSRHRVVKVGASFKTLEQWNTWNTLEREVEN